MDSSCLVLTKPRNSDSTTAAMPAPVRAKPNARASSAGASALAQDPPAAMYNTNSGEFFELPCQKGLQTKPTTTHFLNAMRGGTLCGERLIGPNHPKLCQEVRQGMILEPQRRKDLEPFDTKSLIHLVGVKGFEPSTPCTPCKCATRLRHTPIEPAIIARTSLDSL